MTLDQTISALEHLAPVLAARGVTGLSVFGSQVTGNTHPESDLDEIFDYDPEGRFNLLDLVAVGRIIEERTGIKADAMTRRGLHPVLECKIENEDIRVY